MAYVRKPNEFTELLITETTDYDDVAALFVNQDANQGGLIGAGQYGGGQFAVTISGLQVPGGQKTLITGVGAYLRVENLPGGGRPVDIDIAIAPLADDPAIETV